MKRYKLLKAPVPVEGLEDVYTVFSNGSVMRNSSRKYIKARPNWAGYMMVHLRHRSINKNVTVHRLVANAFIEKPDSEYDVDHIDNNKSNNNVENLQWLSRSENIKKAFKQGRPSPKGNSITNRRGYRSPVAKLSQENVKDIKKMLTNRELMQKDIAKMFNVSPQDICNIKKGRNYVK